MKRVNKILILFLFLLSVSFLITWEFLQSKWVAQKVSHVATKYVTEVLDAEIQFENLQFNLFPPGATVKNLSFEGKKKNIQISAGASSVGVYFNPLDVFETNFIVDKIVLSDGMVSVQVEKQAEDNPKVNSVKKDQKPIDYFKVLPEVPLNLIEFNDVGLNINQNFFKTNFLKITNKRVLVGIRGLIENYNIKQVSGIDRMVDSVAIDIEMDKDEILASEILLKSDFTSLSAEGSVKNYFSKNIKYDLDVSAELPINQLHDFLDFEQVGSLQRGVASVEATVRGSGNRFKSEIEIQGENLITDFADAQSISGKISVDNTNIIFKEFLLEGTESSLRLLEPFEFFNFEIKKFVEEPILAEVKKLKLSNGLKYLNKNIGFLEGEVSGKLRFDLYEKSFSFNIFEGTKVQGLSVSLQDELKAFETKELSVDSGVVNVAGQDLSLSFLLKSEETEISLSASSSNGVFQLEIPNSFVDVSKLGPIMGYNVLGKGLLNVRIDSKNNSTTIAIKNDIKKFKFEEYAFDKIKGDILIDTTNNRININKVSGSSGKTKLFARGVYNIAKNDLILNYAVEDANFSETKRVLSPLLKNVKITTNEIHGDWNLRGQITGPATPEGIVVKGQLNGRNNYFFDESVDNFTFNYAFSEGVLRVDDFFAKKAGGSINLKFSYDTFNESLSFWSKLQEIPLSETTHYSRLPFTLKGNLSGVLSGEYKNKKWTGGSKLRLSDTYSFSVSYPDSFLDFEVQDDLIKTDINLFDKEIVVNSNIFLVSKKAGDSYLNVDVNIPNIRNLFGIVSVVDLSNSDISGRVKYQLKSRFNPQTLKLEDLQTNMINFVVNKKPIFVRYKDSNPEIIIEDGVIKKWDVNIRGKKFYTISSGTGNIYKDFKTSTQLKVDASFIEVFNNIINKANGSIRGSVEYGSKQGKELYEAFLTSNNLTLASDFLPTAVTKAEFKISLREKTLDIEKFYAQLIAGTLDIKGKINLSNIIPELNIRYNFKDAGLTVMDKSNLVFSGDGSFVGKTFPYTLGGDFYLQKFVLVNEVTDFVGGEGKLASEEIDFLPGDKFIESEQLVNFNVNVSTRNPMYVRNSLADLGFVGNIQLLGSEKKPRLLGKINLAARNNKVTFKNNEFAFTKGNVFFSEQSEYKNPELDFSANTNINEYKVNVSVVGPVKNFNVDLTSEPALAQADILSLVAFGYTEDLSNNLTDNERESMTRAGVGSIIFDSFKINETLKKEFGLQVNLGTDITQDETSLLSGRNSADGNNVGRVRSATTFEIKKKINDAMSLSVSSTVGTSTQQRQSINLNYNLNKSVSVEGVYETRNTDDIETINNDNSVGADVKWKWSFK